jgi:PPOX class probable F420-dependent enzyme
VAIRGAVLDDGVRRFLGAPRFAVFATLNRDGSPHLTVTWFELRGEEIIVNTTAARMKARNLSRDPRASILIGAAERYVRIDGRARQIATGGEALDDIRRLAVRYDGPEAAERNVRDVWSKQERVTFALLPDRLYRYGFE